LTIKELKGKMKKKLPGRAAHLAFSPLRNYQMETTNFKKAAVALHLLIREKEMRLLLIKRTTYNGAHSRQIAFPGGKYDPGDLDLEDTARRESLEEVGMPMNQGEFIGELSEVLIPVSSFSVTPFVFVHKEYPQFVKEDREVQEVLDCNLNELDTFKFKTFQNVRARKGMIINGVPGIDYEGHFIWGATALILHEFNTILKMK
jgi:8-oxo-dGTP pyrophosphatase MutT (NUDIX family)